MNESVEFLRKIEEECDNGLLAGMIATMCRKSGERVRTLHQAVTSAAHNYFEWDGTNDSGSKVASGTYIGRMTIDGANEKFFKMAVLK